MSIDQRNRLPPNHVSIRTANSENTGPIDSTTLSANPDRLPPNHVSDESIRIANSENTGPMHWTRMDWTTLTNSPFARRFLEQYENPNEHLNDNHNNVNHKT